MFSYWIRLDTRGVSDRGGRNRAFAVLPLKALKGYEISTSMNFVFEMTKALLVVEHRNLRRDFEWQLREEFDINLKIRDYKTLLPRFAFPIEGTKECWIAEVLPHPSAELIFNIGCRRDNIHFRRFCEATVVEWMYPIHPILEVLRGPYGDELKIRIQELSEEDVEVEAILN
jgi:hypothetical protein